jgi:hypothetical protein
MRFMAAKITRTAGYFCTRWGKVLANIPGTHPPIIEFSDHPIT